MPVTENRLNGTQKVNSDWQALPLPQDITKKGIYTGTAGFEHPAWIGRFYPQDMAIAGKGWAHRSYKQFLYYQRYFPLVEITSTFEAEPRLQMFMELAKRSWDRTTFSVQVHQKMSHRRTWDRQEGRKLMQQHVQAVSPLAETGKFYSFIISLAEENDRSLAKLDYLLAIAEVAVRKRMDVHIEFKHKSWHLEHVLKRMKDNGIGICNTDLPASATAFPLKAYATSSKGYIRYSGKEGNDYLYTVDEIISRVEGQQLLLRKTDSVAIAYTNFGNGNAVVNAIENMIQLNEILP